LFAGGIAVNAFGVGRDELAFVAFDGWDAAGAKWFGHRTYWENRLGSPAEELGVRADAGSRDLSELKDFLEA